MVEDDLDFDEGTGKLNTHLCTSCKETNPDRFKKNDATLCKKCKRLTKRDKEFPGYEKLVKLQGGSFCYACERTLIECHSTTLNVFEDIDTKRGALLCGSCIWIASHRSHFRKLFGNPLPLSSEDLKAARGDQED